MNNAQGKRRFVPGQEETNSGSTGPPQECEACTNPTTHENEHADKDEDERISIDEPNNDICFADFPREVACRRSRLFRPSDAFIHEVVARDSRFDVDIASGAVAAALTSSLLCCQLFTFT